MDLERLRYPNSGLANVMNTLTKGLMEIGSLDVSIYGPVEILEKTFPKAHRISWQSWDKFFGVNVSRYDIIQVSHQCSRYFKHVPDHCIKVVVVHDLNFLYESIGEHKRQKIIGKMQRCLHEADCIVCISNFVKNDFIKNRALFDLPKLKFVTTIYNGLNFDEPEGITGTMFPELKGKKYILNIGVLMDKKNQLSLVKMLPYTDDDLVLVHSEVKEDYLKQINDEIGKLRLNHRVHFYNNISEIEKQMLLKNCVALCHPSVAEGFGIPPIEAMYFGKPVFLSNKTSLPEIGGDLAFYFDDFDPQAMAETFNKGMKEYEDDPDLSEKLRNRAKTFDYHTMAERYDSLYRELLSGRA